MEDSNKESDLKKDITIRRVNKELYDLFSQNKSKLGKSVGEAFDTLIDISIIHPRRFHEFRRHYGHHSHRTKKKYSIEMIRDLDNLTISKADLVSAGKNIMFLFRNIKNLCFDESVDPGTLVSHVKLIVRSEVKFNKEIPNILQLGLIRKKSNYIHPKDPINLKDITIRKVSAFIYDDFMVKAKEDNLTTGEFLSQLLYNFLPMIHIGEVKREMSGQNFLIIKNESKLSITKEDLEILEDRVVIFYGIQQLSFSNKIPSELFLKTVVRIINCDEVILPVNTPRLIAISRLIGCKSTIINDEKKIA